LAWACPGQDKLALPCVGQSRVV